MKFLVNGLGSIGRRHAQNLISLGHEVYGNDPLGTGPIPRWDGQDVDAELICTPTSEHASGLYQAAANGRHIFVEKPIACVATDKRLIEGLKIAKQKNLIVSCGMMLRFHPNIRLAKFMIKKPTKAIFQVLQKNERYKDPVILNWGSHEIDLALYLFGPAKVTDAIGTNERASVTLEHDNGMISVINMDYLTEPEVRRFEVDEEDMTHEIDLTLHNWNDIYIEEMKAFVGLIEGRADPRCATGDDGLAVLELINDAQRMACVQSS